jgi:hypothetical protein
MDHGAAAVRLHEHRLAFLPTLTQRWLGAAALTVDYADIVSVTMVEPHGMGRGTLSVHVCGQPEPHIVRFRASRLREMRRLHVDIFQRVRTLSSDAEDA